MNNYGNKLLEEYYELQNKELLGILQFHVDYVDSYPKNNGGYSSYHTDIDSGSGGGSGGSGDGDCTGNNGCDAVIGVCGLICCCRYIPNICETIECFTDMCC